MKTVKKIVILLLIFFPINNILLAETPHFIDFKFILNESNAGKKAQLFLKNKLDKGVKNIQAKQNKFNDYFHLSVYTHCIVYGSGEVRGVSSGVRGGFLEEF